MSNIFSEAVNQFPYSNLWALLFFCMVSEDHCRIETIEKLLPFCAAVHPWSGLPVWHSAGGHPGCCGPQNISWHNEKRISNWYNFFIKTFSVLNGTITLQEPYACCCVWCPWCSATTRATTPSPSMTTSVAASRSLSSLCLSALELPTSMVSKGGEDTLFHYLKPTVHTNISILRFSEDIQLMTGTRPGLYLCICWKYISPTIMITILVSFCIKMFIGDLSYEVRSEGGHEVIQLLCSGLGCCHRERCAEVLALLGVRHHCHPHRDVHRLDPCRGSPAVRKAPILNDWHMMSLTILNVNDNTNPRLCGFTLLRREKAAWFPTEELRDDNNVQPHKVIYIY